MGRIVNAPTGNLGDEEAVTAAPISVIVVSYNTEAYLKKCLASLYADASDLIRDVIVIDNDSADGSVEMVQRDFPQVKIVRNRANVGYAKAVNQGIKESAGSYLLILNPDIEACPGSITSLWSFMEKTPQAGIAGAKLLNPDGSLQMSCRTFYSAAVVLLRRTLLGRIFPNTRLVRKHLMLDWDHNSDREVDWVTGACMMVRRKAYESVGGMDERFFLYFEDVDWCYRMKKHGWKVYYVHSSVMRHAYRRESARLFPDRTLISHLLSTFRFYDKWSSVMYSLRRERRVLAVTGTALLDIFLINVSFALAYYFRYLISHMATSGFLAKPLFSIATYRDFMIFVNVVCLFSFVYSGLYRRQAGTTFARELIKVSRAVLLSSLVIMAATYLTRTIAYSRFVVLVFWPIAALLVTGGRAAQRGIHNRLRQSLFDLRRVAIVGADESAVNLMRTLVTGGGGYDFVGYVAPPGREPAVDVRPMIGGTGDVRSMITEHRIQEIVVCDRELSRQDIGSIVVAARSCGAEVKVVSEVTDMLIRGSQMEELAGMPVVVFPAISLTGARLITKYLCDFLCALIGMVGLLVLTPAILIGRAVNRCGYRGWARVLKQLWLVLSGRRSLVGPKRPVEGERIRVGITGPWLTARRQSTKTQEDRLDMYYLQNWSVSSDLEIVLMSLKGLPSLFGSRCREVG